MILVIFYFLGLICIHGGHQAFGLPLEDKAYNTLQPLYGQNKPPQGNTSVHVSVTVEKLTFVDDTNFLFGAILHIYLSWTDPRIQGDTLPLLSSGIDCERPCEIGYELSQSELCCDDLWLPTVFISNLHQYTTEMTGSYTEAVILPQQDAKGKLTGNVVWRQYARAQFYTHMTFDSFPFDVQMLNVEFKARSQSESAAVYLQPSRLLYQLKPRFIREDIHGWKIDNGAHDIFWGRGTELNKCEQQGAAAHPGDPLPSLINQTAMPVQPYVTMFVLVHRVSDYHVIASLMPISLIVVLVYPVYFINRSKLQSRLQLLVTLYLTLAASQFFMDKPKHDGPLLPDKLGLMAYFILTVSGIESVMAYYLVKRTPLHQTHGQRLSAYNPRFSQMRDLHVYDEDDESVEDVTQLPTEWRTMEQYRKSMRRNRSTKPTREQPSRNALNGKRVVSSLQKSTQAVAEVALRDIDNKCCGVLVQLQGSVDCFTYLFKRWTLQVSYSPEKSAAVAYYLDVWTLGLLSVGSIATMAILTLIAFSAGQSVTHEFVLKSYEARKNGCIQEVYGTLNP